MTTHRHWTLAADEAQLMARLVMAQEVADASQAVADRARARLARYSARQAARIADGTITVATDARRQPPLAADVAS